jgi:hypothetical protein
MSNEVPFVEMTYHPYILTAPTVYNYAFPLLNSKILLQP